MLICATCSGLDGVDWQSEPREDRPYLLLEFQRLRNSANAGCESCRFFYEVTKVKPRNRETDAEDPDQCPPTSKPIILYRGYRNEFWVKLAGPSGTFTWALSLCNAYGFEPRLEVDDTSYTKDESWGGTTELFGRSITDSSGSEDAFDLAAQWLVRCSKSHENCTEPKDVPLPKRLIFIPSDDKLEVRLQFFSTGSPLGKYVALSHCWGTKQRTRTTRENVKMYEKRIPTKALSRNFRDAICITRRLGFKYLWIDALCIIQDSIQDWEHESAKMATVYGNATFTIAADAASDSEQGILASRHTLRSHIFGPNKDLQFQDLSSSLRFDEISTLPLSRRGWALQERVTAPRILHYMRTQMAWECNTTSYHEESRIRTYLGPLDVNESTYRKNKVSRFLNISAASQQKTTAQSLCDEEDYESLMQVYYVCVNNFSLRKLTYRSDTLPAFSGIASALKKEVLGEYLAGLWEADIFRGLVWYVWYDRWDGKPRDAYIAPTWSWAAFEGLENKIKNDGTSNLWAIELWRNRDTEWSEKIAAERMVEQKEWERRWGPRLLDHKMLLATNDKHGQLESGSYIVLEGFCRSVYWRIASESMVTDDYKDDLVNFEKFYLDDMPRHSYHQVWFTKPDGFVPEAKEILCIQLVREKAAYYDVWGLLLECVDEEAGIYRRAGVISVKIEFQKEDMEKGLWERRTLKLV